MTMEDPRAIAARNNAEWCDLVCRAHGVRTALDERSWRALTRSPNLYPDAVTLAPDTTVDDVLDDIDASAGCSIKDSFASLDLSGLGFRVLFEAQWVVSATIPSTSTATGGLSWAVVRTEVELAEWELAWGGTAGTRLFTTGLLDDDRVLVLAGRFAGVVVGGAVLSRGDDVDVAGLSNFFVAPEHADGARSDCAAFAASLVPGSYLCGYESGADLVDAMSAGFEPIGPLRIWLRDAP